MTIELVCDMSTCPDKESGKCVTCRHRNVPVDEHGDVVPTVGQVWFRRGCYNNGVDNPQARLLRIDSISDGVVHCTNGDRQKKKVSLSRLNGKDYWHLSVPEKES